jgi:hypothetical protein
LSAVIRDIAPGLWIWRLQHPDWTPEAECSPPVTSTRVESRGEVALIDPLAPPEGAAELWDRLDARPPTILAVLNGTRNERCRRCGPCSSSRSST